jgi:hypothetical protein
LIVVLLVVGAYAENIPGTSFDLDNITGANDYVITVNILNGDIFRVFSRELSSYDTDLKKEMFLESAESKPYIQRINELKTRLKNQGITVIIPNNKAIVSNYDTAKKGFWITIGNQDDGYYKPSINEYIYSKLSVVEEKSSWTGRISYKILVPASREQAVSMDGKSGLRVKLQMKISSLQDISISAGGWTFKEKYPVASSMKLIVFSNDNIYLEHNF